MSADHPGAAAFAIVGAAVGALGAVPLAILGGPGGEPWLGAIAAVATMTLTTGAIHVDGLADTADALAAGDPDAAERARKDPSVGPAGASALLLALGAEVAALTSLASSLGPIATGLGLLAIVAVSRVVPVIAVRAFGRRPVADGLGAWFAARVSTKDAVLAAVSATTIVAGVGFATSWTVAGGAILGLVLGLAAAAAITTMRGALDGDGMGAAVEVSVVAGLAASAILAG